MSVEAGQTLSHYRLIEKIGEGGMGVVWKALDTKLDREVAIKVLPEELSASPERLARFEREAKAVAALSHPNILEIFDFGTEGEITYAVTELLNGETVGKLLEGGPLGWRKATEIGAAIADGLAAAHQAGIVHRDLKPSNIFLTENGRVKLLDFGLARHEEVKREEGATQAPTLTRHTDPGMVLGTVGYMSPEQVKGDQVDGRSDIFSLGCVLYEMVSGEKPFPRDTAVETMTAILKEEPTDISTSGEALPPELAGNVGRCLEKRPQSRFQSASDLAYNLRTISSASGSLAGQPAARFTGWRRAALWLVPIVVAMIGIVWWNPGNWRGRLSTPGGSVDSDSIDSLAVLPFVATESDPDTEYLSEGIPASIIDRLSKLSGLRVVPRSSAFYFRGHEQDLGEIGQRLKVAAVLTGQLRAQNGTLVIRAELIDVANDRQLWGNRYTGELDDILATEEEIATRVSKALRLELSGQDHARLAKSHTSSAEAHRLYLKGRFHLEMREETEFRRAIKLFQDAIDIDPTYARAHAGLADAYILYTAFGHVRPKEGFPAAENAARKALDIDDTFAEAYVSMAAIQESYHWDYSAAEMHYRRAIELDASYSLAHLWLAYNLTSTGRFDEAALEIERAQELDPLSLANHALAASLHLLAGRYEQAEEAVQIAHDLDPENQWVYRSRGVIYAAQARYEEAKAEFEKAGRILETVCYEGWLAARMGMIDEARRVLEELIDRSRHEYVPPSYVAWIYVALGQEDEAFEWLERAYEERDYRLGFLKVDPFFDPLRDDPRFDDLLRRVGLGEE